MSYLFLQALFASLFGLLIKWVGNRNKDLPREDIFVVGAISYIASLAFSIPWFMQQERSELMIGAAWTGGTMGAIYFVGYLFVTACIRWVGVTATTIVSVLSLLMPIVFAAFYWRESPTSLQVVGVTLALVALMMIGGKKGGMKAQRPWFTPIALFGFFVICGSSRLMQDTFKRVSEAEFKPTFLLATFAVASIPSLFLLIHSMGIKRRKLLLTEVLFGIGMGAANVLQSFFILKCLDGLPGFIVFPVTSAGAVLITTAVATCVLDERLSKRTYVGVGITIIALLCLNWS